MWFLPWSEVVVAVKGDASEVSPITTYTVYAAMHCYCTADLRCCNLDPKCTRPTCCVVVPGQGLQFSDHVYQRIKYFYL